MRLYYAVVYTFASGLGEQSRAVFAGFWALSRSNLAGIVRDKDAQSGPAKQKLIEGFRV